MTENRTQILGGALRGLALQGDRNLPPEIVDSFVVVCNYLEIYSQKMSLILASSLGGVSPYSF